MKRIIFMIAVISTASFIQPAFAGKPGHPGINKAVLAAFSKDFILTSKDTWHKIGDVLVVDFYQVDTEYTAYYTEDGILNSISHTIDKNRLPSMLATRLNKKYDNAEIIKVLKVRSLTKGVSYIIQLATKSRQHIIQADDDGSIENIRTIKI